MNKIMVYLMLGAISFTCEAKDIQWQYETFYGFKQTLRLNKDNHISKTSEDVTIEEIECADKDHQFCISTLRLTLMIPAFNKLNENWEFDNTEFSLIKRTSKLSILGNEYNDVLFVRSKKTIFTDISQTSVTYVYHEFIFSFENGLLAYRKTDEEYKSGYFLISNMLCNLGGNCLK